MHRWMVDGGGRRFVAASINHGLALGLKVRVGADGADALQEG